MLARLSIVDAEKSWKVGGEREDVLTPRLPSIVQRCQMYWVLELTSSTATTPRG